MSSPTSETRRFGRYELTGLLGRGAMGEVYRALDTDLDRTVALKVLSAHHAADQEYCDRFRREAGIGAKLSNPHIVPIHHYGEIDGQLYLDMQLVEGTDLATELRSGPLPVLEAVDVVGQVASALDAAHAKNVVHRDVKPSNVLISEAGSDGRRFAYLCDFGVARPIASTAPPLTQLGVMLGTTAYMPPEQWEGDRAVDGRADVYSLTCLLYEALTGVRPFPYDTPAALLRAHLDLPPPRPSVVGLPVALDAVIARGMAKDRADRFDTSGELSRAAIAAVRLPAPPVPQPAATWPVVAGPPTTPSTADPPPLNPPVAARLWARLADPWAALIAVVSGGLTWAVLPDDPLAIPLGIGVAAVVFNVKLVVEALLDRSADDQPPDITEITRPPPRT